MPASFYMMLDVTLRIARHFFFGLEFPFLPGHALTVAAFLEVSMVSPV